MNIDVRQDDLSSAEVQSLIAEHLSGMHSNSPPGHVHALAIESLRAPNITFWTAWMDGALCGCGALKELDPQTGEVKSMRTRAAFLRRGVGQAVLDEIIRTARRRGYSRLLLETGTGEAFEPAHALYRRNGFAWSGPFGEYLATDFNVFMSKTLCSGTMGTDREIRSVAIVGVGGVGGYFGGKLCRLLEDGSGMDISFVARGEHLRVIQESGLLLSSESHGDIICRPSLATDDFRRLPPLDLCLICVKEFDLPAVLSGLKPIAGDDTIILPLLNGVDVYSRVRRVIDTGVVLPACAYVGTHIERPGKVFQRGGACKILFGPDPLHPDFDPQEMTSLFERAEIRSEWTPDIQVEIWKKFIFICAYGLVSAAYNKTLGEILQDKMLAEETRMIMQEAVTLAQASGVPLPAGIVEASLLKAQGFPFEAKTSFQRDFERADRNDERDLFAGTMIRVGSELEIEVPRTKAVTAILAARKPVQQYT